MLYRFDCLSNCGRVVLGVINKNPHVGSVRSGVEVIIACLQNIASLR